MIVMLLKKIAIIFAMTALAANANGRTECRRDPSDSMLIRISEIEVYPQYLEEYLKYAAVVGSTSVKEESGVICIYPMQQKRDSTQIRILEIYASDEAYKHHIETPHFLKYKTGTLHMVKRLDLVDMKTFDDAGMSYLFLKMRNEALSEDCRKASGR